MGSKKKAKNLPLHTWETHPQANRGEANKSLIISIITIIILITLSLLLFFSDGFVGKAVEFGDLDENTIGINVVYGNMIPGESQLFDVSINLGDKNSTSLFFEIEYDSTVFDVNCDQISAHLDSLFNGGTITINESSCANGKITFNYSSTDIFNEITEEQVIAQIKFTVKSGTTPTTTTLNITDFMIYDVNAGGTNTVSLTSSNATVEIVSASEEEGAPCVSNCGSKQCGSDGCGESCGTCDEGQSCQSGSCIADEVEETCDPSTIANGTISEFPGCTIICNQGFVLNDTICEEEGELDNLEEDELDDFVSQDNYQSNKKDSCESVITCGTWSFCNSSLQQYRACVDTNDCGSKYLETQNCTSCIESWVCSDWSDCQNMLQDRTCHDLHSCETIILKPMLQKSCTLTNTPGPMVPIDLPSSQPPPQFAELETPDLEPEIEVQTQQPSFIKENLNFIVGGLGGLIFLIVLIFVILHFIHHKPVQHDIDELKAWVQKERAAGTSDEDIKQILGKHTGWSDEELAKAFQSLNTSE